jgi:hypothetical protein
MVMGNHFCEVEDVAFMAAATSPPAEVVFKGRDSFISSNHTITSSQRPPSNVSSVEDLTSIRNTNALLHNSSPTNMVNGSTNCSETGLSVFPLTPTLPAASTEPSATIAIPALCVAAYPMVLPNVHPKDIPIITKLKADAWELTLTNAGIINKFIDIPVGLQEGFYCSLKNYSLSCTAIPPNHYTSQNL